MSKLLFIGIDALDAIQLDRFAADLPHLSRLRAEGFYARMESVWPPDSETAWATIYTGWNPARHGIVEFVDPLQKSATYMMRERDNEVFRGATFWDIAGAHQRQVAVLFPHVGYPSWPVNGVMITRANVGDEVSVTPAHLRDDLRVQDFQGVKGLVGRAPQDFLDANRALVERQLALNLDVMRRQPWDLFFTYWSALDLVQHQFWAYCDPQDPTYPGETPYRHAIRDFYILHDQVVGRLLEQVDDDTTVIVMSDHGHGMRPVKLFNINRLLREHGLLTLKEGSASRSADLLKVLKKRAMNTVTRYHLGNVAARVLRAAPWTKKLYIGSTNLDLDRTIACTTDMSGIKAYAYGGIRIARQNLNGRSYEAVVQQIKDLLTGVDDPENGGSRIVRWIKHREELYSGPHLERYPDLVFELDSGYGAGWDAAGPLFDVSHSHNLYPGSHLGSTAVFMLSGPAQARIVRSPRSLMDIAPTVLDVLQVALPPDMDGSSVLQPLAAMDAP
ncbi:MAG: hypothetical protein GXY36_06130 [Chloroflexi bacterium]|nr:hypothetical protein [Chloroflexota bacterium]